MSFERKALGKKGEDFSSEYLEKNGYKIIVRNFSNRRGEIDIIAIENDTLIFVEVRTVSTPLIDPEETITAEKRKRIRRTAEYFLLKNPEFADQDLRFDLCAVEMKREMPVLRHLKNIF